MDKDTPKTKQKSLAAKAKPLLRRFFDRDPRDVAQDLLGKLLIRRQGARIMAGRVVETEAYMGVTDAAAHSAAGITTRNAVLFGPPGYAYVYMIYGFYFCLNVVTDHPEYPSAVLVRAIEPLKNTNLMRALRGHPKLDTGIGSGPGKLCRALSIDKRLNGEDFEGTIIWVEDRHFKPETICTSPRVGVDYAGVYKDKPWRFYVDGNPHVSRARFKNLGVQ
jgi:DNA-3-methyladenine glycosylase